MCIQATKNIQSTKPWLKAVSYTHLDVYKRQVEFYERQNFVTEKTTFHNINEFVSIEDLKNNNNRKNKKD